MSVYFDTSVIVPIFLLDPFNGPVQSFLASDPADIIVSDFVAAEFSSVVSMRFRTKVLTAAEARKAFSNFDSWVAAKTIGAQTLSSDIRVAEQSVRRLDVPLRTPDAVNIAIADRLSATLATFDKQMAGAAKKLGLTVARL